jgi:phospholipase C
VATPIQHIVVVIQENRSVDNLFNGFCASTNQCAFTVNTYQGKPFTQVPLSGGPQSYDPNHLHGNLNPNSPVGFVKDFDNGLNDGWTYSMCGGPPPGYTACDVSFVDPNDTKTYFKLAAQWVLGDQMYQTNEGPSFPAHQYLIAGQSGGIQDSGPWGPNHSPWAEAENPGFLSAGCGHPNPQPTAIAINMTSPYPGNEDPAHSYVPCIDYPTIFDRLDSVLGATNINWKYYVPTVQEIWDAPCGVNHLFQNHCGIGQLGRNVVLDVTGSQFQTDVQAGQLAPVTYIAPCTSWSDHPRVYFPGKTTQTGPNWVNFIVNTIGQSSYWLNTTVIVVWDDWGGWYDHMTPFHSPNAYNNPNDPNEYGYRVPFMVISPYLAAPGTVDHYPLTVPIPHPPLRTQASILGYIEATFGLPSLNAADTVADDLTEMFNYSRTPISFTSVTPTTGFPAGPGDCSQGFDVNLDG